MAIILFFFGTIIGSFLNVVILRLPKGKKLDGRSHCPNCGHELSALELVPCFSFLLLGGKCKKCKAKISWRYFTVECITGFLFALTWLFFKPSDAVGAVLLLRVLFAVSVLTVVFAIDFEHYLILDKVVYPAIFVVTLFNLALALLLRQGIGNFSGYFMGGILGALAAAAPFFALWYFSKGSWMGFGDVKFALLLGSLLGCSGFLVNFMAAVFLGCAVSLVLLAKKTKTLKSQIPFGTFLSIGALVALYFGPQILRWYLSIMGF